MPASEYCHPTERKSQHAHIVQHLGLKIVSGEIAENKKIPSEAELCEAFSVSRPVFREAVRVLNAKGLTYSKPRVGTVVKPRSEWHLLDSDVLFWLVQTMAEKDAFQMFATVRRMLEPELAFLAASMATPNEIKDIEKAYAAMETARNDEEFLFPDLEFHQAIARATHNDILIYLCKILALPFEQSMRITNLRPQLHEHSVPRHKAILTAIQNHDALAARYASLVQLEDAKVAYDSARLNQFSE